MPERPEISESKKIEEGLNSWRTDNQAFKALKDELFPPPVRGELIPDDEVELCDGPDLTVTNVDDPRGILE